MFYSVRIIVFRPTFLHAPGAEADKRGDTEGEDVDNFDLGGPGMEMDDQQLGVGGEGYGDEMDPQDDAAAGNQVRRFISGLCAFVFLF